MTRIPIAVFALLLTGVAPAASAQDITGPWDVTVESPQGSLTIEATFKQEGDAVTGTVMSPMGSVEFKGTLVKDVLTVNYSLPLQGQTLDIVMTGKVAGDVITGVVSTAGVGEVPYSAKRKPAAPAAAAEPAPAPAAAPSAAPPASAGGTNVSGNWNFVIVLPQGELSLTAALQQEGEKVTGMLTGPAGTLPVSGTMVGTALTLDFVAVTPNGDLPITMTGELGGSGLTGKSSMGGLGEADWTGTRVP